MYRNIDAIALRTIKHSDRNAILSLWTAQSGRLSVAIPVTATKSAGRIRALTQPLSPLQAEVDIRPDRQIYNIRDIRPRHVISGISLEPSKTVTAMFLADFLDLSLRDQQPDSRLSDFLFSAIEALDSLPLKSAVNFHIYLLLKLSHFLGIEPDWGSRGDIFDFRDACFRTSAPLHGDCLDPQESRALRQLQRMTLRNMHLYRLSRSQRATILHRLLHYYSIHHRSMTSLPSIDVISAM